MGLAHGASEPLGVRTGLLVYLDAGNFKSYPRIGTTWSDRSGNNNTATLVNGPTFITSNITSVAGSLVFDGTNDYANFSSRLLTSAATDVSCFMWVYPRSDGTLLSVIGQSAIETGYHHSSIEVGSAGGLRMGLWNGSSVSTVSSTVTFNAWNNIGFTYSGTTLTGYKNGASVGTATFTWSKPPDIFFGIMAIDSTLAGILSPAAYGDGYVGGFFVYNKALTAAEVLQNHDAFRSRYGI